MKYYKEIIVPVPTSLKWLAIDEDGAVYVTPSEPIYKPITGMWLEGGEMIRVGQGPKPRDASKELYRI